MPTLPTPLTLDELTTWAVGAIGAYKAEVIKRRTTALCLDAYRKQGVIR